MSVSKNSYDVGDEMTTVRIPIDSNVSTGQNSEPGTSKTAPQIVRMHNQGEVILHIDPADENNNVLPDRNPTKGLAGMYKITINIDKGGTKVEIINLETGKPLTPSDKTFFEKFPEKLGDLATVLSGISVVNTFSGTATAIAANVLSGLGAIVALPAFVYAGATHNVQAILLNGGNLLIYVGTALDSMTEFNNAEDRQFVRAGTLITLVGSGLVAASFAPDLVGRAAGWIRQYFCRPDQKNEPARRPTTLNIPMPSNSSTPSENPTTFKFDSPLTPSGRLVRQRLSTQSYEN